MNRRSADLSKIGHHFRKDNRYYHNDRDYVIQVVAVDGGAGWGEREGRAVVEAKPIFYHSRPFMKPPPPPDPLEEIPDECK